MSRCPVCGPTPIPMRVTTDDGESVCIVCGIWYLDVSFLLLLLGAARKMKRLAA